MGLVYLRPMHDMHPGCDVSVDSAGAMRYINRLIRSCGSCPDGAASLVCHFSHDLPTCQHYLSPVPVVNDLIGTGKETSLFRDRQNTDSYIVFGTKIKWCKHVQGGVGGVFM